MSKKWSAVGEYLKANAGQGVALVGSLLTGNVPGAVAAGVALVSSATGSNNAEEVLAQLQGNPESLVRLKELAYQEQENIRAHIRAMAEIEAKNEQAEHHETQETIRAGDKAGDKLVRWTRPLQSWLSLAAGITYVFARDNPDEFILGTLLALAWAYHGLRTMDKRGRVAANAGAR